MKNIVCFGELLLRLAAPAKETLLRSAQLEAGFGGAEANVGLALAAFGHHSRIVTTLPANSVGEACLGELRRYGADTRGIRLLPGRMGLYYLTPAAQLRPARVEYDRAHSAFALAEPHRYDWPALLAGADWLHVSGITPALGPQAARALDEAVSHAAALGIALSVDCNYRPTLWTGRGAEARAALRQLAQQAQLLFAGPNDAAMLFDAELGAGSHTQHCDRAAEAMFAACPRVQQIASTVRVVHHAEHHTLSGYLADRTGSSVSRSFELLPLIERIGAGDAYAAGILHGLCVGMGRAATVDFAAAATALKHCIPGDFSTTRVSEVDALLADASRDVQR